MELKKGERYNWKNQPERLIYLGTARYPGDRYPWYQFAKVDQPDVVWCEVTEYDLQHFEETAVANVELSASQQRKDEP